MPTLPRTPSADFLHEGPRPPRAIRGEWSQKIRLEWALSDENSILNRALRLAGLFFQSALMDFRPIHATGWRSGNAQADLVAFDGDNGNDDVAVNYDLFADFA